MRARLCAALATVAVGAALLPVYADSAPATSAAAHPQITDAAGDANGVNDQDTGTAQISAQTGADDAAADITSVLFQTVFKTTTTTKTIVVITKKKGKKFRITKTITTTTKVPNGFTVTMTLSAAPDSNTVYDVQATGSVCDGTIDMQFSSNAQIPVNDISCLPASLSASSTTIAGTAAVVGSTIVWTLPASAIPVKTALTGLFAQTFLFTAEPTLDEAYGDGTYTVGS